MSPLARAILSDDVKQPVWTPAYSINKASRASEQLILALWRPEHVDAIAELVRDCIKGAPADSLKTRAELLLSIAGAEFDQTHGEAA